jgi:hypothetical protein
MALQPSLGLFPERRPERVADRPAHPPADGPTLTAGYETRPRLRDGVVKTVRFAEVVRMAGKPEVHLLLTDPALDPVLKEAIKSNRVMTVYQAAVGNKTDFGTVGFVEGAMGQVLIFPKPLHSFDGRNVVGINYDLLKEESHLSRFLRPKAKRPKPSRSHQGPDVGKKIVPFPLHQLNRDEKIGDKSSVEEIKKLARRALKALAEGKQVLAHQLLQTIVES